MPTEIERSYVKQGYRLPAGLTWAQVKARRSKWGVDATMVPVALAPGCIGWGVPFVDGKPMKHP